MTSGLAAISANLESLFLLIVEEVRYVGFYFLKLGFAMSQQLLATADIVGELSDLKFTTLHRLNNMLQLLEGLFIGEFFLLHNNRMGYIRIGGAACGLRR